MHRAKRLLSSKAILLIVVVSGLIWWWSNGGREDLHVMKLKSSGLKELFAPEITKNLQFYPASNPKIHVRSYHGKLCMIKTREAESIPSMLEDGQRHQISSGRTAHSQVGYSFHIEAMKDCLPAIQGVYFDVTISNTSTLLLSLRNSPEHASRSPTGSPTATANPSHSKQAGHLSFHSATLSSTAAPPISLLAHVDMEEYVLLPNSSSLVSVRLGDLDPNKDHNVRIIAPMTDDLGQGVVEMEGVWISKGAKLLRVEGSLLNQEVEDEDGLHAENDNIGRKHRLGLSTLIADSASSTMTDDEDEENEADGAVRIPGKRRKLLEVVTDTPGLFRGKSRGSRTGGADGLLAGVMAWEYLLGEMFRVDHVGVIVDGMCLVQDCIGGAGGPSGMGDVFFRRLAPYTNTVALEASNLWKSNIVIADLQV